MLLKGLRTVIALSPQQKSEAFPEGRLSWTEQSRSAFQQLKQKFMTAPILHHPYQKFPFMVEVDASTWAVLSQHHGDPGKMHPCTFFSRKLTLAEANYDMGNQELLSIKTALERWWHWLE